MTATLPAMQAVAVTLVPEEPAHAQGVRAVTDTAFGPGRHAKTSERVREHGAAHAPGLSRVALLQGAVIGCCQIWRVRIGGAPGLFLGPLAVHPRHQSAGLGQALTRACLDAARAEGARAIVLVGAAGFFAPLGFTQVPAGRLTLAGPVDPRRLLWASLDGRALDFAGAVSGFRDASQP